VDDFDFYRLYKTLHVLAVIYLGGGIAIETIIGPFLARATSVQELKVLTRISRTTELFVNLPALFLIAGFGYAVAGRANLDLDVTWLLLGQIIFYVAAVVALGYLGIGALILHGRVARLEDGPIPKEMARQLKNPLPPIVGALLTVAYVFIVYLMVSQPDW
jgi:uncharacterized membrane protein